jgi:hypothetical protein
VGAPFIHFLEKGECSSSIVIGRGGVREEEECQTQPSGGLSTIETKGMPSTDTKLLPSLTYAALIAIKSTNST